MAENKHATAARRWTIGLAIASTGAIIAATVGALPAVAASVVTVSSADDLAAALQSPPDTHTFIDLGADIDATASTFAVPSSVSIDLEGFELDASSIRIASGADLRILDSTGGGKLLAAGGDEQAGISVPSGAGLVIAGGAVQATGGSGSAAIGGDDSQQVGSITIDGGTVVATGGDSGAAIGGGNNEGAGDIQINGGHVTATGGVSGAGIGAGSSLNGIGGYEPGSVLILGGTVTAVGGEYAAGVGGGAAGTAGVISIGDGATVTASSTSGPGGLASAVGGGLQEPEFTSIDILGTLKLPAGQKLTVPADATITVHRGGLVSGSAATLGGRGTIANDGTLAVASIDDVRNATPGTLSVTGNDYAVTFDSNAGDATPGSVTEQIYASSLADASLAFPTVTRSHWELTGWTDEEGDPVTVNSVFTGDTTRSAEWGFSHVVVAPVVGSKLTVGSATQFVATGEDAALNSLGDHTADVVFTSNGSGDTVSGASVTFGSAGSRTITATSRIDSAVIGSALVSAGAGTLTTIAINPATLSVATGDSHVFTTTGSDEQGNPLGVVAATYTSSSSTDVITAATGSIKFTKTGTRTITAHSGGFTSTSVVTVTPGNFGTPTVSVSGTRSFGHTLTAHVVAASVPGKKASYRWYRGSSAISGATHSTYKLGKNDLGHSLRAKVTLSATNYTSTSATSAAVAISKDAPTVSIAVPSTLGINVSGTATVTLGAGKSLAKPTGSLKLVVNGKVYKSISIGSSTGLRWLVPIKFTKKETLTIYASYAGSSIYASKKSSSKTLKVS